MCKEANDHQLDKLWIELESKQSVDARNALFEYYAPWSRKVAGSLFAKYKHYLLDWNDFISVTSFGLLESIDQYKIAQGTPFEAFSYPRLKGHILNEIRKLPRHENEQQATPLYQDHYRISDEFDNEFDSLESIISYTLDLAFGMFLETGSVDSDLQYQQYNHYQISNILVDLVEQLEDKQRFVIKNYYYQHLNYSEIARIMKLSKARVSQLHKNATQELRKLYEQNY